MITLLIGLYHIFTAVMIAKDGVTFIHYAQHISVDAKKPMLENDQHPGFPVMIAVCQRITSKIFDDNSTSSWIYSGQAVALLFRLLGIAVFYSLAFNLLKDKFKSFIATLILIFLPELAHYGSDCLSDWPHLFFLLAAYMFAMIGATKKRVRFFALAGLTAGAGYLIRPECAQVIAVSGLWLVMQFFYSKREIPISKIIFAGLAMVVGFAIFAGPYMHFKGAIFPKKHVGEFAVKVDNAQYHASIAPEKIAKATKKFIDNSARTYMYYFLPSAVIGLVIWMRSRNKADSDRFIIGAALFLNIAILFWLYSKYEYMSIRHTMPIFVIVALFIPLGIERIAYWTSKTKPSVDDISKGIVIITLIGISICSIRLFRPVHVEKKLYLEAAKWLADNTSSDASVCVEDSRISFYANRKEAKDGDYKVIKVRDGKPKPTEKPIVTFTSDDYDYEMLIFGS